MGGLAAWPVALAKDVLRLFRDLCAKATDDLMLVGALLTAPDGKTKVVAIGAGHFGSKADGEKALAPIKAFKQPIMDELGPLPYVAINGLLDGAFPHRRAQLLEVAFPRTSSATTRLPQRSTSRRGCPTPMGQIVFEHFHGAATRVPVGETAYALRSSGFNTLVMSEWLDRGARRRRASTWGKKGYAAIKPFGGSAALRQLPEPRRRRETRRWPRSTGRTCRSCARSRRSTDPDNVFHLNVNIKPA